MRFTLPIIALVFTSSPAMAQALESTEFYLLSEGSNDAIASRVLGRMFHERWAAPGEGVDICKEAFEVQMNGGTPVHPSVRPAETVLLEQIKTSSTSLGARGVNGSVVGDEASKQFLTFDVTAQMDVVVDEVMLRDCCRRSQCPAYYVRSIFKVGSGTLLQQRKQSFEVQTGDIPVDLKAARAAGFGNSRPLDGTWSVALLSRVPDGIAVRTPCRLPGRLATINAVPETSVRTEQSLNVRIADWTRVIDERRVELESRGYPVVQSCVSYRDPEGHDRSLRFDASMLPVMPEDTQGNVYVYGVKPNRCESGPAWAASMVGAGLGFTTAAVTAGIAGWAGYTLQDTTLIRDGGPSAELKETADGVFYPMVAGAAVGALAGGVGLFAASQFDECKDR